MAKVHITLVGGQPTPVYKGIIDEQPDKVVLVCSSDTNQLAKNIKYFACMNIPGLQCELMQINPVDISETYDNMKEIASLLGADDIMTINISGGTKVWTVLFYDFFKDKAERLFYIDQDDNKLDFVSGATTQINVQLSVKEALGLNNVGVTERLLTDYCQEDFDAIQKVREMRKFSPKNFSQLMLQFDNQKDREIDQYNYLSYDRQNNSFTLSLSNRYTRREMEICSPNVRNIVLHTGWFELEVAKLLSEWAEPSQIAMNCGLSSLNRGNGLTLNEIDIIVNKSGRLLFVECKTQIAPGENTVVDKFNNAIRSFGGLSTKGVFFTDYEMRSQAKEKCKNDGILYYSMQTLRREGDEGKRRLFTELDNHMRGLNIR